MRKRSLTGERNVIDSVPSVNTDKCYCLDWARVCFHTSI